MRGLGFDPHVLECVIFFLKKEKKIEQVGRFIHEMWEAQKRSGPVQIVVTC